ncbi:MAG: response regulator transcription factor [Melioribacteraceae bacterium]|nr:response regulator transcription factor [Melioribacteraceae bacterium]MCF8353633.1 response regulator transcription factor [Melioribacteraceae bacterium]MCF8393403.1 response regulator transcription factor [Melioribacteraceae bacterium]MCF8419260.1 response regulator transcription factor [Melioribacteraceae bacterium]
MNKKILLVEDDINLGTLLKEFLEIKKFDVVHAVNGEEGSAEFGKDKYDLCILDIMMPKKDGFTLAKEIRATNENIPIIFLTAKSMQHDKLEGFKIGADDYVTKPFSTEELFFRINAILKRIGKSEGKEKTNSSKFVIGKYTFDYMKRELKFEKESQKLTSKEAELLKLLCISENEVLERSHALKEIWSDDNYFSSRSMDVYIAKLRNYLKKDDSIEIVNVHGVGFKLII